MRRGVLFKYGEIDNSPGDGVISRVFAAVVDILERMASLLGMTYNEINIIFYYFLLPLSWTILFDLYIGKPYSTAVLLLVWLGVVILKWRKFGEWCDWLFDRSVDFLNWFNCLGGNYELNSVVICVVVPVAIYATLIALLVWK